MTEDVKLVAFFVAVICLMGAIEWISRRRDLDN